MQEYEQLKKYDCIVVGGGASGLAAISAMADLGITNTILLEKNAEVGGSLLTDSEPLSLSGKSFSGKSLLTQFLRLMEIYEVKSAFHRDLISVSLSDFPTFFTLSVKNTMSQKEELYCCNYLILAFSNSKTFSLHDAGIPEDRVKIIEGKSLSDALISGGKVGREMGELLLRKK